MPKPADVAVHPQFRHRLRELRKKAGLSLRALDALSNYSYSYLHDLESGRKQPTAETAARLDAALSADGQLTTLITVRLPTPAPSATPPPDTRRGAEAGLEFPPNWRQGIDNATGLWRWNLQRRGLLRDVAFSAAAFPHPSDAVADLPAGRAPGRYR